jgi:hypothetical protein
MIYAAHFDGLSIREISGNDMLKKPVIALVIDRNIRH